MTKFVAFVFATVHQACAKRSRVSCPGCRCGTPPARMPVTGMGLLVVAIFAIAVAFAPSCLEGKVEWKVECRVEWGWRMGESGVASGRWECAEREEWTSEQSVESGEWSLRVGVWRGEN